MDFLERLNLVANFKTVPILEAHTTFRAFTHLCHVFFDVLEGVESA